MDWFRLRFPYYYDRCDVCGASERDTSVSFSQQHHQASGGESTNNSVDHCASTAAVTPLSNPQNRFPSNNNNNVEQRDEDEEEEDSGAFLGYVYPNEEELKGKASRTELYLCKNCGSLTRFPRYNSASWIVRKGRGRCGEYSMLLYRMLRAVGFEARWVVDWSDHVWCEVKLTGRWVHLDPCEAAVDRPFLYQDWGKEQTYIMAFNAPPVYMIMGRRKSKLNALGIDCVSSASEEGNDSYRREPLIEDVTSMYTSDSVENILKRREEPSQQIGKSLEEVQNSLWIKLHLVGSRCCKE